MSTIETLRQRVLTAREHVRDGHGVFVALQESDTIAGTYAALPVAATAPTITASNRFVIINARRSKRWVRAVGTIGGATPSFAFAVAIVGQRSPL